MKSDEMKTPKEIWLEEYAKKRTRERYSTDFDDFCEWAETSDVELVEEYRQAKDKKQWAKLKGSEIVRYYNSLTAERGYSTNYARSRISGIRAFLRSQCETVRIGRGKIAKPKPAMGEHEFSQMELRKMFFYGDVREKAILATAVSLGWGVGDFKELKRDFIEPFLEKPPFTGFFYERGKTGVITRSHLTPEAIETLKQWLKIAPEGQYVWSNGNDGHLTDDTFNNILRGMVEKAAIKTTGDVHFHLIRKFLMSQLSNAGLTSWHIKFMVGKSVPSDIQTYLVDLKQQLAKEYEEAYSLFSLVGYQNQSRNRITQLEQQIQRQQKQIEDLQAFIRNFAMLFGIPKEDAERRMQELMKTNPDEYMRIKRLLETLPKK